MKGRNLFRVPTLDFKERLLLYLLFCCTGAIAQVKPIEHGHAHNDYMHKRPLFEALESGFTSIEIDVFLYHDDLIVSHTAVGLDKKPDIEKLYLKPIQKIIQQNGGVVYKGYPVPVIFMIDIKTDGDAVYTKLKEILGKYTEMLAVYNGDSFIKPGPIHILLSGNKPYKSLIKEETSFATLDADLNKINQSDYDRIITRFSDPWGQYFTWNGKGDMPAAQREKLDSLVAKAHQKGKQIRFYGIPDKPAVWKLLLEAHVDWVNTDKLKEYRSFYLKGNDNVIK